MCFPTSPKPAGTTGSWPMHCSTRSGSPCCAARHSAPTARATSGSATQTGLRTCPKPRIASRPSSARRCAPDGAGMATPPRPSLDEVAALLDSADVVPVVVELPTGRLTPVDVMRVLGTDSPCFLLESAEGREHLARWSILGHGPVDSIECDDAATDPLAVLQRDVASRRFAAIDGLDVPFAGGAVGFLSYEAVRHYERVPSARDVLHIPDA